ncbi:hypothetical protein [Gordonia terrae]
MEDAVKVLGLAASSEFRVIEVADWYRAGSESFVYVFDLVSNDGVQRLLLKSFISGSGDTAGGFADVLARRKQISMAGLSTPTLYCAHRATVLEEFIPYSLREVLSRQDPGGIRPILHRIFETARVVDSLGYAPQGFLADVRSRGSDVVLVDFGSDFGSASVMSAESCIQQSVEYIAQFASVDRRTIEAIVKKFELEAGG